MKPVCTKEFDYHNHTILIVDNSPDKLNVIVRYLTDSGFKVILARNGETALDLAQSRPPDLILLDTMLPGIDGFETCRLLKENQATQHILIIFMTLMNQPENAVKGFELGAVDYVTKPFHQEELLARVNTHLQLKDLTENLETKVREQTEALLSANKKLYQKIKEKDAVAAALQESESRYRAVIENSNDGIGIMEAGKIVFINEKMLEIFDYDTRQELMYQHISVLFHPDEKDRISRYN
jgi:DNA-binding response OmpR family regulator